MQIKMVWFGMAMVGVAAISFAAGAAIQKKATMMAAAEMKWEDYAPGSPLKGVSLWGNRAKGQYGMLLKLPGGTNAGMHKHTGDYHAVNIQGDWWHGDDGGEMKQLPVGSYVMQPGGAFHNDECRGTGECIVFIHQHKKGDFIPKPAPKETK